MCLVRTIGWIVRLLGVATFITIGVCMALINFARPVL